MNGPAAIRLFQPGDETAVRRICIETGFLGDSLAPVFPDVELAADLMISSYYILEPGSFFVMQSKPAPVSGYLAGCLKTRPFMRACRRRGLLILLRSMLFKGHLFRPASWSFTRFAIRYGLRQTRLQHAVLSSYPSHLHINLSAEARGLGGGSALMDAFLDHAARAGSPGIHLTTPSLKAREFFLKNRFTIAGEAAFPHYRDRARGTLTLMVRDLS